MGTILAVQLGVTEPSTQYNENFRCVLAVRGPLLSLIQSTRFYGDSLFIIGHDIGSITTEIRFKNFVMEFAKNPTVWGELPNVPPPMQFTGPPGAPGYSLLAGYPTPALGALVPDASGPLVPVGAGFDPFRGYWIEFAGNYDLGFPVFKNYPVTRVR